jgi:magnesium-transporting ATPase (P-type)
MSSILITLSYFFLSFFLILKVPFCLRAYNQYENSFNPERPQITSTEPPKNPKNRTVTRKLVLSNVIIGLILILVLIWITTNLVLISKNQNQMTEVKDRINETIKTLKQFDMFHGMKNNKTILSKIITTSTTVYHLLSNSRLIEKTSTLN